ncbi:MAG: DUF1841 family protein [Calditrichaeota bacterium]|nr:MAG: DUF1841 family protein [Calditrichota bacterium]
MGNKTANLLLKSSRHHMHTIWEAAQKNEIDGLDEEDARLAQIMLEHEDEFHNEFEYADILEDYEFDPEREKNPFAHIIIHSVIENQLREKKPIEVYQFYNNMSNKKSNRHDTIHMISYIFIHFLYQTLKYKVPFDEAAYRKALKSFKDKKPEKVWPALEKGLDQFTSR